MTACQTISPQRPSSPSPAKAPGQLQTLSLAGQLRHGMASLFSFVERPLRVWGTRRRDRRELQRMPDHLLLDMGIDIATARRESERSVWRV